MGPAKPKGMAGWLSAAKFPRLKYRPVLMLLSRLFVTRVGIIRRRHGWSSDTYPVKLTEVARISRRSAVRWYLYDTDYPAFSFYSDL